MHPNTWVPGTWIPGSDKKVLKTFSSSDGRGGDMGKNEKAHVLLPGLEVIVKKLSDLNDDDCPTLFYH